MGCVEAFICFGASSHSSPHLLELTRSLQRPARFVLFRASVCGRLVLTDDVDGRCAANVLRASSAALARCAAR